MVERYNTGELQRRLDKLRNTRPAYLEGIPNNVPPGRNGGNGPKVPKAGNTGPKAPNNAALNALVKELNGTKRPYRRTGAFLRGAGAAGKGLVSLTGQGLGRLGGLAATGLMRLSRPNAALVTRLQSELENLESRSNANPKNIASKRARIAQILARKNPTQRANIAAVAGYASGQGGLPNVVPTDNKGVPLNTNFNFSGNPYAEIVRARQVYNKANRATKQQIIGKIMKGMANIWKNRSSNTVAKATLKHIVNRGPKHANISRLYESLAGRGVSSFRSSSNISRLLGLRPGSSSSSSLAGLAPSLLRSLGGSSSNFERLLRGPSAPSYPPMPMAAPTMPMAAPPPSYPMPVPVPSYQASAPPPSFNQLPPSIRTAVTNAGGMKRANNMINNIGGPEMVKVTSRALVRAHGNINVAARQTGMPPRVFKNIKNLGGPTIAPRVAARLVVVRRRRPVAASRRVTVTKRRSRRPVVVVKRRVAKKTRRVSVRRGPAIKDIKKLVHRLRKSELETRVVQCLMR